MTPKKLVSLYEELKAHRKLEISYTEFRDKYSSIKGFYEQGYPEHSTVCISLWGLQYRFPEHDFSNDMIIAIEQLIKDDKELDEYRKKQHRQISKAKKAITDLIRKTESAKRQIMQTTFSLLECYLNGLAWSYFHKNSAKLSNRKANTLQDISNVTLRDKIRKYPFIIFEEEIDERSYQFLIDEAKQFRDSLMHPSPFSAPERFGGYDKLEKLYNLDIDTISKSVKGAIEVIEKIESMKGKAAPIPIWLPEIKTAANQLFYLIAKGQSERTTEIH